MTQIRESRLTASTSHNTNGGDIEVVTTDTRFATKLDSIDDVPEPMRGALVEKVPLHESIRLLVHAQDPDLFEAKEVFIRGAGAECLFQPSTRNRQYRLHYWLSRARAGL